MGPLGGRAPPHFLSPKREYREYRGSIYSLRGSLKDYVLGSLGFFLRAFEGFLEGALGSAKANALVMLASSGA